MAPYEEVEGGELQPVLPSAAPCGGDGRACRVVRHDRRDRKTGPGFALLVVRCRTHEASFTVYPPAWVPYGREPVAPEPQRSGPESCGSWQQTIFGAAISAADGEAAWSREPDGGPGWRTQLRRIERAGTWLGLEASPRLAEAVAHTLGVPLEVEIEARSRYEQAGFRNRASAVAAVVEAIAPRPAPWRRFFAAGSLTGVVGRAWYADPQGALLALFHA